MPVRNASLPPEIVLGMKAVPRTRHRQSEPLKHQTTDYETVSVEVDGPGDPEKLARALVDPRLGLLRAKGFLRSLDGTLVTLHIVGRRSLVEPAPAWVEGPGRLVCIGLAAEMDRAALLAAIDLHAREISGDKAAELSISPTRIGNRLTG